MLRLLALLAGLAGVGGFFLPLAQYRDASGALTRTASPYDIATTEYDAEAVAELARGFGASDEAAEELAAAAEQSLLAYRGAIVAFYVPAALLALLALVNLFRSQVGRFAGFAILLLGAANGVVFGYFYVGAQRSDDPNAALGYGVWALAVAAGLGVLAGLSTLFAPRRR